MMNPESIKAYQRFDSRGRPTVMARLEVEDNGRIISVQSLVPSGASTGSREAFELRDGGTEYLGHGVSRAINNVSEIANAISGLKVTDQETVDQRMKDLDGTDDKSRLGANSILAVSLAVARAGAEYRRMPLFLYLAEMYGEPNPTLLPTPMMNVVNGGVHASNGLAFQEFMIVPTGARRFAEAMRMGTEVYGRLGKIIETDGVGDEGGYSPIFGLPFDQLMKTQEILRSLSKSVRDVGYQPGRSGISFALDVAASEFYRSRKYQKLFHAERGLGFRDIDFREMVNIHAELVAEFPIISIEDGVAEDDKEGWEYLTDRLGRHTQLVGDDLFVTNPAIFREGIKNRVANAILIKLNQIGTLTETLQVMRMAKEVVYNTIISHRSGETEDPFIADLAVATRAGQIKTGAPARGERTAKYNRLLDIEEIELPKLGLTPEYAGFAPFSRS